MIDEPKSDKHSEHDELLKNDLDNKPKKGKFTLFIAWMALFFTAIGITVGYKNWVAINDKAKFNREHIESIIGSLQDLPSQDSIDKIQTQFEKTAKAHDKTLAETLKEMEQLKQQAQNYADTIESQVSEVTRIQGRLQQSIAPIKGEDWLVAETEFLLKMANRQLHLNKDKNTAMQLLKDADQNIAKLGESYFLPVRHQLARDLSALNALKITSPANVSSEISKLMHSLSPLPATDAAPSTGEPIQVIHLDKTEAEGDVSGWQNFKQQAQKVIHDAVIIRKHDKPLHSALDMETRQQLYQLIMIRLETLRLMAFERLDDSYQAQITLIKRSITQYYPEDKQASLLNEVNALATYQLSPQMPNISGSLTQFRAALNSRTAPVSEAE